MAQAVAMEKKKASAPGELSICAFVMVAPELCDDLRRGLKRVDDVPVSLERIALSELPEPVISEKEVPFQISRLF